MRHLGTIPARAWTRSPPGRGLGPTLRVAVLAVLVLVVGQSLAIAATPPPVPAPAKAPAADPAKPAAPAATAPAPDPSPAARAAVYPKPRTEMEALAKSNPLELLRVALKWYDERVLSYTCLFMKQENINGELRKPETMRMKFRASAFSVYVKWTGEQSKNQEVIYVEGSNDNKAVVHPAGILGMIGRKVSVDPNSKLALKHSRRPITVAGMGNMLRLVIPQCETAKTNGDLALTYEGIREEAGRPCYVFKRVLPNHKDYPCAILVTYIDVEYLVCCRTDAYDWNGDLISTYSYSDLIINAPLTDTDFNPDNREYGYRYF